VIVVSDAGVVVSDDGVVVAVNIASPLGEGCKRPVVVAVGLVMAIRFVISRVAMLAAIMVIVIGFVLTGNATLLFLLGAVRAMGAVRASSGGVRVDIVIVEEGDAVAADGTALC